MSKIQRFINYLPDPRTRRTIRKLFMAGDAITREIGDSIPSAGRHGYAPGCEYILANPLKGQCPRWINMGDDGGKHLNGSTTTPVGCLFVPVGPVLGYGIKHAGGPVTSAGGDTAESITLQGLAMDTDIPIVGHEVSNDSDQIDQIVIDEGSLALTLNANPATDHGYVYALLRNLCLPDWDIVAAGSHTTVGGGAAEAITVSGVLATDIAFACFGETEDSDVISDVLCSADTVTVTCSADPEDGHVINYMVIRPRGTFKPSHYIFAAGEHTSVADASDPYQNTITVTGVKAGDIVLAGWKTNAAGDDILAAKATANTITVSFSADPSTTKVVRYVVLRAY
jgi:hypothetical protein